MSFTMQVFRAQTLLNRNSVFRKQCPALEAINNERHIRPDDSSPGHGIESNDCCISSEDRKQSTLVMIMESDLHEDVCEPLAHIL